MATTVTNSPDPIAFITARLDEDENLAALAIADGRADWEAYDQRPEPTDLYREWAVAGPDADGWGDRGASARHAARHDPRRVLADIAANRLILGWHSRSECRGHNGPWLPCNEQNCTYECDEDKAEWPCPTVQAMAVPFASHPDYQEAWSVA
jgi:hypothetical protein